MAQREGTDTIRQLLEVAAMLEDWRGPCLDRVGGISASSLFAAEKKLRDAVSALDALPAATSGPDLETECCGVGIDGQRRYCPKCGWECRVVAAFPAATTPVSDLIERLEDAILHKRMEVILCENTATEAQMARLDGKEKTWRTRAELQRIDIQLLTDALVQLKPAPAVPAPAEAKEQVAWLIETTDPRYATRYYAGPADKNPQGNWCDNPNHATRFQTKDEALSLVSQFQKRDGYRVVEHMWIGAPAPPADAPRWTAYEVERQAESLMLAHRHDERSSTTLHRLTSVAIEMLRAYAHSLAAAPSGGARQESAVTLTKQDVENLRADCLGTYAGGHHSDGHLEAFQHGMETVCNHLGSWIPTPTPQPKGKD